MFKLAVQTDLNFQHLRCLRKDLRQFPSITENNNKV